MRSPQQTNLIRKQYLVSESNIQKLRRIATERGTSATEIVRQAIDAFDPEQTNALEQSELLALVSTRLKEAIKDTQETRKRLSKTLSKLERK